MGEKATLLIQGKNVSGKLITSLEIIPKNNVVMPEKKIFFPLEMIFTCNWPSAHTLTIKGDFGKMFLNIANNMNEVSVMGVLESLGQQYKYSTILSIREKMFTVTFQEPSKELYDVVMKVKMLNGFPMLEITGNIPTIQYFTAGDFKTEVIVKSWLSYDIKHTFHGMEMMRLTFGMLNGFPRMEITGNVPACKYLTAGTFKTEVIVHSLLNYEVKHAFNGVEMLKLTFGMLNGFPKVEISGKIPTFKYFTAGDFKTAIIVNSWLNYEIKHIFNGLEMLRLTFEMLNGFPMIEITGSVPTTPLFTAGVFKSELIMRSLYNYEIKHVFKGMEMLNLNIALINGKMEMIMKYGQTPKSDKMPIMKFGGYYGLTLDSTKYEILLNDFYI